MVTIRELTIADYDEINHLLQSTPGVTVREADARDATASYLERNPGLSFVAVADGRVVGCVMCGHDGRRGYLQHLVVLPAYRRQGLGERLFSACLVALERLGICKTHLFVLKDNHLAQRYWAAKGWQRRDDVEMYSYNRSANPNA